MAKQVIKQLDKIDWLDKWAGLSYEDYFISQLEIAYYINLFLWARPGVGKLANGGYSTNVLKKAESKDSMKFLDG